MAYVGALSCQASTSFGRVGTGACAHNAPGIRSTAAAARVPFRAASLSSSDRKARSTRLHKLRAHAEERLDTADGGKLTEDVHALMEDDGEDLSQLSVDELDRRLAHLNAQVEEWEAYLGEEDDVEEDFGDEDDEEDEDEDSEDREERLFKAGEEGILVKESDFEAEIIQISRVTKVVKGGRQIGFRAVVVLGNGNGVVGLGCDSGKEVAQATTRAYLDAKKHLITFPLTADRSIPHRVDGIWGAAKVMMRPAAQGTGAIAGGAVRSVLELAGVQNCLAKQLGSTNLLNNARATVNGLQQLRTFEQVAEMRGKTLEDLLGDQADKYRSRRPKGEPQELEADVEPLWAGDGEDAAEDAVDDEEEEAVLAGAS